MTPLAAEEVHLLAVDLGLRCGWAAFDETGRLLGYGSRHYGNRSALRKAIPQILGAYPHLARLVVEGGGELYSPWAVSYTHLRAHETPEHLVCRLLLEKK